MECGGIQWKHHLASYSLEHTGKVKPCFGPKIITCSHPMVNRDVVRNTPAIELHIGKIMVTKLKNSGTKSLIKIFDVEKIIE